MKPSLSPQTYRHFTPTWTRPQVLISPPHILANLFLSGYGQWTLWGVCGATADGKNVNCGKLTPAFPFDPAANFGTGSVPDAFISNSSFYYYTTRFMFAFFLIAVAFAVFSIFTGLLALCSRLGSAVTSIFCAVTALPPSCIALLCTTKADTN